MDYKKYIKNVANFPKEGIDFKDISILLQEPIVFSQIIDDMSVKLQNVDVIVGLDARGFIFGGAIAYKLKKPFVIVRKAGKLPCKTIGIDYALEYGTNSLEIHEDSIKSGDKVAIVDDLLATGGTAFATCNLVEQLGGIVDSFNFVINLSNLDGEKLLKNYNTNYLVNY